MAEVPGATDSLHGHNTRNIYTICLPFDVTTNVHHHIDYFVPPPTHQDTTATAPTDPGPPYIPDTAPVVDNFQYSVVSMLYYLTCHGLKK